MTENQSHIVVEDLTMAYGDFIIQRNLNFTVQHGDIFLIMGGSGCGKSTIMRALVGLKEPAKGQVLYEGENFWETEPGDRDKTMRRFGVMFQSGALWSSMTLAENVLAMKCTASAALTVIASLIEDAIPDSAKS